jgi:16S rRNA (uracil1498-N3)-methyltransferase
MGVGDTFILNEGGGEDVEVEIVDTGTSSKKYGGSTSVQLKVLARHQAWVPKIAVHVLLATIRKERFEWALEKCTELGVSKISPLTTDRAERGSVPRSRAERILKEAAEQCGRGNVPEYSNVEDLESAISTAVKGGKIVIACVHSGQPFSEFVSSKLLTAHHSLLTSCSIIIGPEGGWTPRELELFKKHNVIEVSLGPTNLRAETAAVTACALILQTAA